MAVMNQLHPDLRKKYDPGRIPEWITWADIKHHARTLNGTVHGPLHLSLTNAKTYWFDVFSPEQLSSTRFNTFVKEFALAYFYFTRYADRYMVTDLRLLTTQLTPQFHPLINYFSFCRGIEARRITGSWWLSPTPDGQVNLHDYFRLLFFLAVAMEEEGIFPAKANVDFTAGPWGRMSGAHAIITGTSTYIKNLKIVEDLLAAIYNELSEDIIPVNLTPQIIERFLRARPAIIEDLARTLNINDGDIDFPKYLSSNVLSSYQLTRSASRPPLAPWILDKIAYPKIYSIEEI